MISLDPVLRRISAMLEERGVGWAIASGWAIDLFLGRVTRPHVDIDIAVWRDGQTRLREALAGWQFSVVVSGQLRAWSPDEIIEPPLHELHARRPDDQEVEFLRARPIEATALIAVPAIAAAVTLAWLAARLVRR